MSSSPAVASSPMRITATTCSTGLVGQAPPMYAHADHPAPARPHGPSTWHYARQLLRDHDFAKSGTIPVDAPYDLRTKAFLCAADSHLDPRHPLDRGDGKVSLSELDAAVSDWVDVNHEGYIDARERRWAAVNFGF